MDDNLFRVVSSDGRFDERFEPRLSGDELKRMYTALVKVRMLDDRMLTLQRQGRVGFYVPSTGEEALQVGSAWVLEKDDWVFPAYREPGAALVRGMPVKKIFAQIYGNSIDTSKGRQMPSHLSDKDVNFVTPSSPVATQVPIAVGAAMAITLRKERNVALVYFGDGATSTGDFHVGMNFAGVFNAPCIFLCKNNQWAISLPFTRQTASQSVAMKAMAYGFEGVRVDGNDVLAVYISTKHAVENARAGKGPTLIEAVTYRMGPHSSSDDPTRYRDAKEVEEWRKRDPITRFRLYLQAKALWDEKWEAEIRKQIEEEFAAVIKEEEAAPKPQVETLFTDVFEDMPWNLREQMEETRARAAKHKGEASEQFPL